MRKLWPDVESVIYVKNIDSLNGRILDTVQFLEMLENLPGKVRDGDTKTDLVQTKTRKDLVKT